MQSRLTSEDVTCRRKPSTWELLTVDPKDSRFFSVCSHPSCDALQKKKTKKKRSHKAPEALQLRERFLGTPFGFANLRIWLVNKPPSHPWMLPRRLKPLVKHLPDVLSIGLFFKGFGVGPLYLHHSTSIFMGIFMSGSIARCIEFRLCNIGNRLKENKFASIYFVRNTDL